MKRALVVLLFALLACTGWILMTVGEPAESDIVSLDAMEPIVEGELAGSLGAIPSKSVEGASNSARRTVIRRTSPDTDSTAGDEQTMAFRLDCRVVLTDSNGFENVYANGTASIVLWGGNRGRTELVAVVNGAFEVQGSGCDSISVRELFLDGAAARLRDSGKRYKMEEGIVVIEAEVPASVLLNVVSAETGEHLNGLLVVGTEEFLSEEMLESACLSRGVGILSSPIELEPTSSDLKSGSVTYWVHSLGYAWQSVDLIMNAGGEREMRLELAGELVIRFLGDPKRSRYSLFLSDASDEFSKPLAMMDVTSPEEVHLCGLPPGAYVASVRTGVWFADTPNLGRVEVEVVAGQTRAFDMTLRPPTRAPRARLEGTVFLPKEWRASKIQLEAEYLGPAPFGVFGTRTLSERRLIPSDSDSQLRSFSFGKIPIGKYSLTVKFMSESEVVRTGQIEKLELRGLQDVSLEVPAPATVSIQFLDPDGVPVVNRHHSFSWSSGLRRGEYGVTINPIRFQEAKGLYEFRAPIGWISVTSFGRTFAKFNHEFLIGEGSNPFVFRLEFGCPLTIAFMDGETPVPQPMFWYPKVEHLDGDGILGSITVGQPEFNTTFSLPGRYVIEMPSLDGFEPIPDPTITVVRGERTTHVVQLVRKSR